MAVIWAVCVCPNVCVCVCDMSRCCFRASAFQSAAVISRMIPERRDNMINLWELNYGALIFHVTFNENTLQDSPLITAPTPLHRRRLAALWVGCGWGWEEGGGWGVVTGLCLTVSSSSSLSTPLRLLWMKALALLDLDILILASLAFCGRWEEKVRESDVVGGRYEWMTNAPVWYPEPEHR